MRIFILAVLMMGSGLLSSTGTVIANNACDIVLERAAFNELSVSSQSDFSSKIRDISRFSQVVNRNSNNSDDLSVVYNSFGLDWNSDRQRNFFSSVNHSRDFSDFIENHERLDLYRRVVSDETSDLYKACLDSNNDKFTVITKETDYADLLNPQFRFIKLSYKKLGSLPVELELEVSHQNIENWESEREIKSTSRDWAKAESTILTSGQQRITLKDGGSEFVFFKISSLSAKTLITFSDTAEAPLPPIDVSIDPTSNVVELKNSLLLKLQSAISIFQAMAEIGRHNVNPDSDGWLRQHGPMKDNHAPFLRGLPTDYKSKMDQLQNQVEMTDDNDYSALLKLESSYFHEMKSFVRSFQVHFRELSSSGKWWPEINVRSTSLKSAGNQYAVHLRAILHRLSIFLPPTNNSQHGLVPQIDSLQRTGLL